MADIFLSYSRSDADAAAKIVHVLEAEGWTVWWDTTMRVGAQWDEVIEREITIARCVLVIWSPISVTRRWVRVEANFALDRNKLVPVSIEGARPPLAFTLTHTTDLSGWDGDPKAPSVKAMIQCVSNMLSGVLTSAGEEWERIKASTDPAELRVFISAYQSYIKNAVDRLSELSDIAWATVLKNPDETALKNFLKLYYDSKHKEEAQKRLDDLERRQSPYGEKRLTVHERIAGTTSRDVLLALWHDEPEAVVERLLALGYMLVPLLEDWQPTKRWLRPGEPFRDFEAGPEMVVIPPGSFLMGSQDKEGKADERPQHQVTIPRAFAAGKHPVTFEQWDAAADALRLRPDDHSWGRGTRPVINVSWDNAQAYVDWLSKITGFFYRLLSEAEWEYACRANTAGPYAFGHSISKRQANFETLLRQGKTTPAGSYPANAFGLHDMHGNVWEWCQDCWNPSYAGAPDDGSPWLSGDCEKRVLRGGSFAMGRRACARRPATGVSRSIRVAERGFASRGTWLRGRWAGLRAIAKLQTPRHKLAGLLCLHGLHISLSMDRPHDARHCR